MDAAQLKERSIVSVAQAVRLGRVDEVLFATEPLRVSALRATGDDGNFVVPFERVRRFGPDAVMVDTPDVREPVGERGTSLRTLGDLTRLAVVDEDGKHLGTVRSVEFDPDSGHVERVVADDKGMLNVGGSTATINARAIRGMSTELMTVASSGEAETKTEKHRE